MNIETMTGGVVLFWSTLLRRFVSVIDDSSNDIYGNDETKDDVEAQRSAKDSHEQMLIRHLLFRPRDRRQRTGRGGRDSGAKFCWWTMCLDHLPPLRFRKRSRLRNTNKEKGQRRQTRLHRRQPLNSLHNETLPPADSISNSKF